MMIQMSIFLGNTTLNLFGSYTGMNAEWFVPAELPNKFSLVYSFEAAFVQLQMSEVRMQLMLSISISLRGKYEQS